MTTIEEYAWKGRGYHPFLIRDHWQVAHLNFDTCLAVDAIDRLERHQTTDEVFVSLRGEPILIGAVAEESRLQLEACVMQAGVTYNVPAGTWHAIVMCPIDEVLIVENANTHLHDVEYRLLDEAESRELRELLKGCLRES